MTRINKLVLKGFKSFAKHTELEFGSAFNCILGPNGSGKSNILDALTFVLGRTSSKAMRAEKSSNLIYNGGKKSQPAPHATVSIHFENSNKTFPIENKEVIVTRTVKKNGNSVYRLNGKRTVRKDIIDFLSLARINPDGYNIILQGDIIRFVEMSTIERRQIVEEIAGIGAYEENKQKAMNELNRVDERLNEAEIVLSERKTHLKELKKERDEALQFKDLNDNLQMSKASLLKIQIEKKQSSISKLNKDENSYNQKNQTDSKKINEMQSQAEEIKTQIDNINKEIERKGEKDQVMLNREIEQLKVNIATNKTKLDSYKNEIDRLKNRKLELEEDTKSTNQRITRLEQEKKDIEKEIEKKEKDIQKIEKDITEFRKRNAFDSDVQNIEKEIDNLEKQAEEKQNHIQKLREAQQESLRDKDKIELMIQNIEDQVDKVAAVRKENKQQLEELKRKRERFKKISDELNKNLDENSSISEKLANSREKLAEINGKLAKLRAQNMNITERMSGDAAVRSILEQKNKIKGIYGTVSELGNVDAKYSPALEVAAGNRIKSIVVENDKIAADCIKHLKDKQLGVATFLPLNKLKTKLISSEIRNMTKKKGVHGLAIDLVEHDPKFNKVFLYVFGDTLVVDDIETARKLGVGTVRMATMEGDLAEVSGAMIGGFRQKRRSAGFKEKGLIEDLNRNEKLASELEKSINAYESRLRDLDEKITKSRHEKAELEAEIITLEKTLHIKGEDTDDLKTAKEKLLEDNKQAEKRIEDVQEKIGDINKELAQVKIKKQQLRNKINDLRKPEVLAELRAFEEKRSELREQVIQLKTELKNFNTQIETILGPDVRKTRDILKNIEKEEIRFGEERNQLKNKIKEQEKTLKDKEENAKIFRAKYKKLFTKRDELSSKLQKLDKKINANQLKIKGIDEKINDIKMKMAAAKAEFAGLEKEFEQYITVKTFETKKSTEELQLTIRELERKQQNIGNVNLRALEVYDNIEKEYFELETKKEKLSGEKEDVLKMIGEIEGKKKEIFVETLEVVNNNFKDFFIKLSKKGEAFLELENAENPFEAGLMIKVRITGNKFLDIKSLSGGEKTLTALAFIFAIQEHEPAHFYILDEVDAALDKHNSEKLSQLVRGYCQKAQYLIISHNDAIISEADKLYGISMGDHGRSNITTLEL
ncbi:chromosome segregation protein SMC [Candidatus Woesearchaeota archaeon]|nr:chromosome segregation protein SMC [Candidatus Woesearchaeota archaeon]